MNLVVNGGSFAWGGGVVKHHFPYVHLQDEKDKLRKENCYPYYLSQLLKCDLDNLSEGGSSVQRIYRTTIEYLNRCTSNDVFVIIEFNSYIRTEVFSNENGWLIITENGSFYKDSGTIEDCNENTSSFFDSYLKDISEEEQQRRLFEIIINLGNALKVKGIPYLFLFDRTPTLLERYNLYLSENYNWFNGSPNSSGIDTIEGYTYTDEKYKHPTIECHQKIAKEIFYQIKDEH